MRDKEIIFLYSLLLFLCAFQEGESHRQRETGEEEDKFVSPGKQQKRKSKEKHQIRAFVWQRKGSGELESRLEQGCEDTGRHSKQTAMN